VGSAPGPEKSSARYLSSSWEQSPRVFTVGESCCRRSTTGAAPTSSPKTESHLPKDLLEANLMLHLVYRLETGWTRKLVATWPRGRSPLLLQDQQDLLAPAAHSPARRVGSHARPGSGGQKLVPALDSQTGSPQVQMELPRQRRQAPAMGLQDSQTHPNFLTVQRGPPQIWTRHPKPVGGPLSSVHRQGSAPAADLCTFGDQLIFGRILVGWLDADASGAEPDLIVANPTYLAPGATGPGHTEAVLVAAEREDTARHWRFAVDPPAILKIRQTQKSAGASASAKRTAARELRQALRVTDAARTEGKDVLVYDDVCTTGSHLNAVADCLMTEGHAARVEGIVLARQPWRPRRESED